MIKRSLVVAGWLLCAASSFAAPPTEIKDRDALAKLMANKGITLQWLNFSPTQKSPRGQVEVLDENGVIRINARQERKAYEGKGEGDFVTLNGYVTKIEKTTFTMKATVRSKVYYFNDGKLCERSGTYDFRIMLKRPYWRIKQQDHECGDTGVDYVDIHF